MARLFVGGDWYEEISHDALYEHEFARIVQANASMWFPGYVVVPFDRSVSSEEGYARSDLALVDTAYREWWVVEIEMGHHSFEGHVLPQVRRLAIAHYGSEEASTLCERAPTLDCNSLLDMVKGRQPRVLVIVNAARPEWARYLRVHGARLTTVEVFRSKENKYIYRVDGETPTRAQHTAMGCHLDPALPSFLVVESPAALTVPRLGVVDLRFRGAVTRWKRLDISDKVWLVPQDGNPLVRHRKYRLNQLEDGSIQVIDPAEV